MVRMVVAIAIKIKGFMMSHIVSPGIIGLTIWYCVCITVARLPITDSNAITKHILAPFFIDIILMFAII